MEVSSTIFKVFGVAKVGMTLNKEISTNYIHVMLINLLPSYVQGDRVRLIDLFARSVPWQNN